VNDVEGYDLLEGPVLESGDVADIDVELYSELAENVTFKPVLRIFPGTYEQQVSVQENTFADIVITPEELFVGQYDLPLEKLTPGVYTAVLAFEGANSNAIIPSIEARFIVDGLEPKIKTVRYGNTNLTETNNEFTVEVTYTDIPVNLRRNEDGTFRDARTAALFATSSNASVIGDASNALLPSGMSARVQINNATTNELLDVQQVAFGMQSPQKVVTFTQVTGVTELQIVVELSRNGEVTDSFSEIVTVATAEDRNFFADLWYAYPMYVIGGVTLVVVLMVVGTFVARRRRQDANRPVIRG
jgi:hypothetical protein